MRAQHCRRRFSGKPECCAQCCRSSCSASSGEPPSRRPSSGTARWCVNGFRSRSTTCQTFRPPAATSRGGAPAENRPATFSAACCLWSFFPPSPRLAWTYGINATSAFIWFGLGSSRPSATCSSAGRGSNPSLPIPARRSGFGTSATTGEAALTVTRCGFFGGRPDPGRAPPLRPLTPAIWFAFWFRLVLLEGGNCSSVGYRSVSKNRAL